MLTVQNLRFSYGRAPVLKDVAFSLKEGELVFLLGANGAGKSTLFSCILGHLPGWQGSIRVQDADTRTLTPKELARRISYIPQSHHPTFSYPALDMVLMGTSHSLPLFASPGPRERKTAMDAMAQVGISGLAQRDFLSLSGGEQQMVLIARALAQQGRILLMDEPTSSLDYGNQTRVLSMTRNLARQGYAILLSCHNPQQALLYADRVIALHDGKIVADGRPEEVITPELVQLLYQVPVQFVHTNHGSLLAPDQKCMFQWNPDMVRFMEDAGSRTDFYRLVAEETAALVPPDSYVCDVGCGLGFSSIELAQRFSRVRAVDLSENALAVLRKNNRFDNLEILQEDAFSMTPAEPYDAMVFCCCGRVPEVIEAARKQCRGSVLVVQRDAKYHRLTTGKLRNQKANFQLMEEEFAQAGIPFQSKRIAVSIGQPLRSIEDGILYFKTYDKSGDLSHITEDFVKERVIPQDDPEFPFYYPMETTMGFLSFRAEDLPPRKDA